MPYRRSYKRRRPTRSTRRYRRRRGTTSKTGSRKRFARRGTAGTKRRAVTRAYRQNLAAAIPLAVPNHAPQSQFRKILWTDSLTMRPTFNSGTIATNGLIGFWIRADRPDNVYTDAAYTNWTGSASAVISANTSATNPDGINMNCKQLFEKFERARVVSAKLTLVATPLISHHSPGGETEYLYADEANVYLTLGDYPWMHTNGTVGTVAHPGPASFDLQHNVRHARNTKAVRTRIQPGAARRGAIMEGKYHPLRLQPRVTFEGTDIEFSTGGAPGSVGEPSNNAFWNVMVLPAGGVWDDSTQNLYEGVVRPHRFDIKVEYVVQFWDRVDSLEADRFQANAPAAP